jgi:hypothetical protein
MFIHLLASLSLATLGVCISLATSPDWFAEGWTTDPVVLLAGPLATGSEVLTSLTNSCVEMDGSSSIQGANCMSDAIYTLLYIAASGDGKISNATDIKNGTLASKRSSDAAKDPDLTLRSISQGSDTIPGSATSIYKLRSTMFEHTSNATHGIVRSIASSDGDKHESQARRSHRRNTFSYGEESKGLKLSYSTSCGFAQFADDSLSSLRDLAYKFAQSSSTTMQSDRYALELFSLGNRNINHMLATLIAEADAYGNDYEEFPFATLFPLATEC